MEGGLLWKINEPGRYFATRGEDFIRWHASVYNTVGEFFEKSSDVKA